MTFSMIDFFTPPPPPKKKIIQKINYDRNVKITLFTANITLCYIRTSIQDYQHTSMITHLVITFHNMSIEN